MKIINKLSFILASLTIASLSQASTLECSTQVGDAGNAWGPSTHFQIKSAGNGSGRVAITADGGAAHFVTKAEKFSVEVKVAADGVIYTNKAKGFELNLFDQPIMIRAHAYKRGTATYEAEGLRHSETVYCN